jgi:hypothetical protein
VRREREAAALCIQRYAALNAPSLQVSMCNQCHHGALRQIELAIPAHVRTSGVMYNTCKLLKLQSTCCTGLQEACWRGGGCRRCSGPHW